VALILEYLSRIRFSPAQWRLARTSFPRRTHATILDMYSWARLVGLRPLRRYLTTESTAVKRPEIRDP